MSEASLEQLQKPFGLCGGGEAPDSGGADYTPMAFEDGGASDPTLDGATPDHGVLSLDTHHAVKLCVFRAWS